MAAVYQRYFPDVDGCTVIIEKRVFLFIGNIYCLKVTGYEARNLLRKRKVLLLYFQIFSISLWLFQYLRKEK